MQACRQSRLLTRLVRQTCHARRSYATANPIKPELYDVVCVGGGPAGLSLVTALRKIPLCRPCAASSAHFCIGASRATSNLRIALIESQDLAKSAGPRHASPVEYSNRCSSLTPASVGFLEGVQRLQPRRRLLAEEQYRNWSMETHRPFKNTSIR